MLDIVLSLIILASGLFGVHSGLVRISINFASFILSIILGLYSVPIIKRALGNYLAEGYSLTIASSLIAYFVILFAYIVLSSRILGVLQDRTYSLFDSFFGLFAGLVRGFLIATFIFITAAIITTKSYKDAKRFGDILNLKDSNYPDWLGKATLSPYLQNAGETIIKIVPKSFLNTKIKADAIELPEELEALDAEFDESLIDIKDE